MDVKNIYTTIKFLEIEMTAAHSDNAGIEAKIRETESYLKAAAESFIAAVTMKITNNKEDLNERTI